MFCAVEVLGGVLVLRGVAAAYFAAFEAEAEVDPGVAHLYALFTFVFLGGFEFDLVEMSAGFGCHASIMHCERGAAKIFDHRGHRVSQGKAVPCVLCAVCGSFFNFDAFFLGLLNC
jgi:hypothetical protein